MRTKGIQTMKIAVTYENGQVFQHFGHTEHFKIYDVADGKVAPDAIDESCFENYLDTAGVPDPDLLIRTSGEQRLSNFLMWQLAYTEFYFTDVPWPDFHKKELIEAIEKYNARDRRYGGVKEE